MSVATLVSDSSLLIQSTEIMGLRDFEALYCLMTPGLSKDIQCHVRYYSFLRLHITRSDIRQHLDCSVRLVIADGY